MCIRCARRRLRWRTNTCCRICCTARSARCGATADIRDREKPSGRRLRASARCDQLESEVQELCGRVTKGQEPSEGQSASEGGTSVPDSEAHLRLREGAIPRDSEEPSSTVRQLCPGEPVPAPQTAGGGEGVVSLKTACMAASGKVGSNTGEFVACAGLKFPPPSTSMVAQRFLGLLLLGCLAFGWRSAYSAAIWNASL